MSRLAQHRAKKTRTQMIALLVLLFVILYFLVKVGFNGLISSALLVSNFSNKETNTPSTTDDNFFGFIEIGSVPTATNSARILVEGQIGQFDTLAFFINGISVKNIKVSEKTSFSEEIEGLTSGENSLYLQAITKNNKHTKKTEPTTVTLIENPPTVTISEPKDGETVRSEEISVKGTTDQDVSVTLNNLPVVLGQNGEFTTRLRLREGDNSLVIRVEDIAGNRTTKELKIRYEKAH